ncbi:unnamed protein product, partial [Didymodactylos carnosus]
RKTNWKITKYGQLVSDICNWDNLGTFASTFLLTTSTIVSSTIIVANAQEPHRTRAALSSAVIEWLRFAVMSIYSGGIVLR